MSARPVLGDPHIATAREWWPAAQWIIGRGRYAIVARCGATRIMLFETLAEAQYAKSFIDRHRDCGDEHEIVDLT